MAADGSYVLPGLGVGRWRVKAALSATQDLPGLSSPFQDFGITAEGQAAQVPPLVLVDTSVGSVAGEVLPPPDDTAQSANGAVAQPLVLVGCVGLGDERVDRGDELGHAAALPAQGLGHRQEHPHDRIIAEQHGARQQRRDRRSSTPPDAFA